MRLPTPGIAAVRRAQDIEWDSCWRTCDFAYYYQSRQWMELWCKLDGMTATPEARLVEFSDGTRVIVPMIVSRIHKGVVKIYSLSAGGAYGGWISTDPLTIDHAASVTRYLLRLGSIQWLSNPRDELVLECDLPCRKIDETQMLFLTGSFDDIVRKWTKGHRSAVQKARRASVSIRRARSIDDWREYYAVYRDSVRRWGESATSDYSLDLFEALGRLESADVVLWLAVHEEKIVAGAICLYARKQVAYWHGAALESYFDRRPVNLLMHEAIRDACERRLDCFDLGLSGGHDGVRAFKKSFGASSVEVASVAATTIWHRLVAAMARARPALSPRRS